MHKYETQIAGSSPAEPFGQPWSLAFDSSGNLLVADPHNSVVDAFGPDNTFSTHVGKGILSGYARSVATDDASGDVYVADSNFSEVLGFKPTGVRPEAGYELFFQWKESPFGNGCCFLFAAVDNHSAGPSDGRAGDVYVLSEVGTVYVVKPEGELEGKVVGELSVPGAGPNGGLAVDSATGNVYVASPESHAVYVFNDKGEEQSSLAITGSETPGGAASFTPIAVAIDNVAGEEAIYVVDEAGKVVDQFSKGGKWLGQIRGTGPEARFQEPLAVAVQEHVGASRGEVYVSDGTAKAVDIFAAGGVVLANVTTGVASGISPTTATLAGTVNPSGVAVSTCRFEYKTSEEASFVHSGACTPPPGSGKSTVPVSTVVSGLSPNTAYRYRLSATDANGTNYGEEETFLTPGAPQVQNQAAEVKAGEKAGQTTATLQAQVDPGGGETTYRFEYGETTTYGKSVPVPDGTLGSGEEFLAVPGAELSELVVGTNYHYRIVATNEYGTTAGPDQNFTTVAAAVVDSYATEVGTTTVTLGAQINPLGSSTSYYFEYGIEECATAIHQCAQAPAAPGEAIGAGEQDLEVTPLQVQDLLANTTYHYRVIAHNALGVASSDDKTFTTSRVATSFALPDGRAWELVSPPDKHDGFIRPLFAEGIAQVSSEGTAVSFLGEPSLLPEAQGSSIFDQVLALRTSSGWSDKDIATPHDSPPGQGVGQGQEYRLFSPDLSNALVQPYGPFTALSSEASERTPYIRDNTDGSYLPLVTSANVPPGTKFGGDPTIGSGAVEVVGSAPDLSHVVLRTSEPGVALTSTSTSGIDGLYEWSAGRLQLVSLLPRAAGGTAVEGYLGYGNQNTSHAISDNGARVIWSESQYPGPLYLRDTETGKEQTLRLDAVQSGAGEGSPSAEFQIASADGSKVFFTDEQHLTTTSGAVGPDLYECEVVETAGVLTCRLTDLTAATKVGESAEVPSNAVLGASQDASYVYFIAHDVLAANKNEATGEEAASGANNLYVLHTAGTETTTTFIATLSGEDESSLKRTLTARVSPSGRYLAFMSNRSLTGYDNRDVNSGKPDEEVFLYDAEGEPHLICASCEPSEGRPAGTFEPESVAVLPPLQLADAPGTWEGSWLAANIPTYENFTQSEPRYQPRDLSDSGRLFFNSADALVPQDVNGQWDVYQYEPAGTGSCSPGGETFASRTGGCVNLISSGRSSQESAFLGASESGGDVFFLTYARLSPQDTDDQVDIYDGHECSLLPCIARAGENTSTSCTTGEACRPGVPTGSAVFGAPASVTLSGAGNVTPMVTAKPKTPGARALKRSKLAAALKACRKRRQKAKRSACERQARERYGPARAKSRAEKAGNNRRAKS